MRFLRFLLVGALLLFWALGIWMFVLLGILDTLPRNLAVLVAIAAYFVLPLGSIWLAGRIYPSTP